MLFLVSLLAAVAAIDSSVWLNKAYQRTVDVSKAYVKETDQILIENTTPTPQKEYFLTLNDGLGFVQGLSAISVQVGPQKVVVTPERVEDAYRIELPVALSPRSTIELVVNYVYVHALAPVPAKIDMGDKQQLLLQLNKFVYSPYPTQGYYLHFTGLTTGQEMALLGDFDTTVAVDATSFTPVVNNKKLSYGPYNGVVPPYTTVPMGMHFEHNRPLGHVYSLNRSVWVPSSNVAQLPIEEYYELANVGAALNKGFSRADWMLGRYEAQRNHWALSHLEFPLVDGETYADYYYSDKVGVVSSHSVVQNHLLLQPRFPLFGGWKYNFTLGWNAQAAAHIRRLNDKPDTYVLRVPLINTLRDVSYNTSHLTFYLPEGSEFVNISSPVPFESLSVSSELSYLDVEKGHVKVTASYKYLIDNLSKVDVYVVYRYPQASYVWRLVKMSAFVFVGLMSYYGLGLVDVSIEASK